MGGGRGDEGREQREEIAELKAQEASTVVPVCEGRPLRACEGPTMTDLTSCTERTISSAISIETTFSVRRGTVPPRNLRLRLMMKMATA